MAVYSRVTEVDTSGPRRRLAAIARRSKDFRPVLRWAFQELQKSHRDNFRTQGAVDGFPWAPLSPEYAAWKLEEYGAHGILVRRGPLESSLTLNNARGAVREIGLNTASFGTEIPYAKFQQTGTRFMPRRKPVFLPPLMAFRTANVVAEYLVHGSIGVQYADALKGFAP